MPKSKAPKTFSAKKFENTKRKVFKMGTPNPNNMPVPKPKAMKKHMKGMM